MARAESLADGDLTVMVHAYGGSPQLQVDHSNKYNGSTCYAYAYNARPLAELDGSTYRINRITGDDTRVLAIMSDYLECRTVWVLRCHLY
jgi:hypothetical protein